MSEINREEIYQQAKEWVLEAGKIIRDSIDKPRQIKTKLNANDLVTEMDQKVEEFFAGKIRGKYAEHRILSEEGFGDDVDDLDGVIWIIDPIDGTMNFVHQKRNFAISLGIYHEGVGEIGFIYDVMADILYHAKRGQGAYKNDQKLEPIDERKDLAESILFINTLWCTPNEYADHKKLAQLVQDVRSTRTYGSAALEFAYLAEGIADCYISFQLHPWDIGAGIIIYNEVGGKTVRTEGGSPTLLRSEPTVAGHPDLIDQVINNYIELK